MASGDATRGKWAKVQIYTATHVCTGQLYCPQQRRLLDVLNGVPIWGDSREGFLPLSEIKMCFPDGREEKAPSAHINKANILFVRETEEGETQGLGGQAGHKLYPFVTKMC